MVYSKFFIIPALLLFFSRVYSQCNCDHVVPYNTHPDGTELNIQPGDTICLDGSVTYENMTFTNIVGTPSEPVVITNCNGQAFINNTTGGYGLKFTYSENFKLLGNGDPSVEYGIKVSTNNSLYLSMEYFTSDFEIGFVEIAGSHPEDLHLSGFSGVTVKTSPYQDCELFEDRTRTAWVMDNISIHDNYIHDTGGEGMYIGHGFYMGRVESGRCSDSTWSHSIKHMKIYNNIIEHVGFDGIQVKNADEDLEIYNNIIYDYGVLNEQPHNEGLFLGEGVTGDIYNNWVQDGTGHGMQFQGMGDNKIYNNIFINSGENGFFGASGPHAYRTPGAPFYIFNNTFINSGSDGFVFYNDDGGQKYFLNNLIIGIGSGFDYVKPGAALTEQGNQTYATLSEAKISYTPLSSGTGKLRMIPEEDSPLVNAAQDLAGYGLELPEDIIGTLRDDGAIDVGAIEYDPAVGTAAPFSGEAELLVFPNPFTSGYLFLEFDATSGGKGDLSILNAKGNTVFQKEVELTYGNNVIKVDEKELDGVEQGLYFVVLKTSTKSETRKISIVR